MSARPNILWFQTDEQRPDSLSCYGSEWAQTPAIKMLAEQGMVFGNAVCQSPVCIPSRSSQLSCRYAHEVAALSNYCEKENWPEDTILVPQVFAEAGYRVCSVGKRHALQGQEMWSEGHGDHVMHGNVAGCVSLGPDYDEAEHNILHRKDNGLILAGTYPDVEVTPTQALVNDGIEFMQDAAGGDQPFFLRVSTNWPHTPVLPPRPWDELYDPDDLPIHRFSAKSIAKRSAFDRDVAARDRLHELSDDQITQIWKDYMGLAAYVDSEFGRLLSALDEQGLSENTIVIFSADHGKNLGQWGSGEKDVFDRNVFRVPFVWSWPGHIPAGKVSDAPCEIIDMGRTLLGLAGISDLAPQEWRGRDLFADEPAEAGFGSIRPDWTYKDEKDCMRVAVLTERYRMDVDWPLDLSRPDREYCDGGLYDAETDPREEFNIFNDPECSAVVTELLDRLEQWVSSTTVDPRLLDHKKMVKITTGPRGLTGAERAHAPCARTSCRGAN